MRQQTAVQPDTAFLTAYFRQRLDHAGVLGGLAHDVGLLSHPQAHHFVRVRGDRRDELGRPAVDRALDRGGVAFRVRAAEAPLHFLVQHEVERGFCGAPVAGPQALVEPADALLAEDLHRRVAVPQVRARAHRHVARLDLHARLDEPQRVGQRVRERAAERARHHVHVGVRAELLGEVVARGVVREEVTSAAR